MARPNHPVRLQLSRERGFDLQRVSHKTNGRPAVKVDRTTWLGNPFKFGQPTDQVRCRRWLALADNIPLPPALMVDHVTDSGHAVMMFRHMLDLAGYDVKAVIREELAGKNLACWCPVNNACHGDTLLRIANGWQQ